MRRLEQAFNQNFKKNKPSEVRGAHDGEGGRGGRLWLCNAQISELPNARKRSGETSIVAER
jgi:hypothetical protein